VAGDGGVAPQERRRDKRILTRQMGVILFFSVLLFSFTSRKRDDCFSPFGRLVRGYTRLLLARGVYGAPTTSFAGNNGTSGFILHAPPSLVRNGDGNRPFAFFQFCFFVIRVSRFRRVITPLHVTLWDKKGIRLGEEMGGWRFFLLLRCRCSFFLCSNKQRQFSRSNDAPSCVFRHSFFIRLFSPTGVIALRSFAKFMNK